MSIYQWDSAHTTQVYIPKTRHDTRVRTHTSRLQKIHKTTNNKSRQVFRRAAEDGGRAGVTQGFTPGSPPPAQEAIEIFLLCDIFVRSP